MQELTRCLDQHSEPLANQIHSTEGKADALRVRSANDA
jgi:hypothetical protein